ncbi:hypothetical protein Arub01_48590 [Actinomadura rubrobrunea]|uniref:Uncharacterized protein n=1 Tax=Actinomadura rubrobrunea TaxID=115335 RepID=A0A9W6PYT0_9ACTN|nr:hypothetical protein Arub01_48590 [Actinomadura rubrobrunea]
MRLPPGGVGVTGESNRKPSYWFQRVAVGGAPSRPNRKIRPPGNAPPGGLASALVLVYADRKAASQPAALTDDPSRRGDPSYGEGSFRVCPARAPGAGAPSPREPRASRPRSQSRQVPRGPVE